MYSQVLLSGGGGGAVQESKTTYSHKKIIKDVKKLLEGIIGVLFRAVGHYRLNNKHVVLFVF